MKRFLIPVFVGLISLNGCAYQVVNEHDEWQKKAEKGDVEAMHSLGVFFASKQNYDQALKWYHEAARRDNTTSMICIGAVHEMHQNYTEAKYWYKQAIARGDAEGMSSLGCLYMAADQNYAKAESCFRKAIAAGDIFALHNLGFIYCHYHNDINQATEWFTQAADKGCVHSMYHLAVLHVTHYKNYTQAIEWLQKGIMHDTDIASKADAMNSIGSIYDTRLEDHIKAEEWYKQAMELGSISAMSNLGVLYLKRKDYSRAQPLLEMAVAAGDDNAKTVLALARFMMCAQKTYQS